MTATIHQLPTARRQPDPIWIVRYEDMQGREQQRRVPAAEPGVAELTVATLCDDLHDLIGRAVMELQPRVPKDAWDLALGLLDEEARRLQAKADRYSLFGRGEWWQEQADVHREAFQRLIQAMVEAQ